MQGDLRSVEYAASRTRPIPTKTYWDILPSLASLSIVMAKEELYLVDEPELFLGLYIKRTANGNSVLSTKILHRGLVQKLPWNVTFTLYAARALGLDLGKMMEGLPDYRGEADEELNSGIDAIVNQAQKAAQNNPQLDKQLKEYHEVFKGSNYYVVTQRFGIKNPFSMVAHPYTEAMLKSCKQQQKEYFLGLQN